MYSVRYRVSRVNDINLCGIRTVVKHYATTSLPKIFPCLFTGTDPEFDISDEVDLAFYKEHDQWKLERPLRITFDNRTFKNVFNYSDMHLNIRLQRHPKFYLIVFIIPSILLYILCPLVFLLPVDSGEKTSMSITLLLAQVVSLGGLSEVLPASSTQFPIVSYYMALTIIHMGVVTVFSIIG